jgi:hypothetical protein
VKLMLPADGALRAGRYIYKGMRRLEMGDPMGGNFIIAKWPGLSEGQ